MGYCGECGSALDPVARNCVRCGAPAPVTVRAGEAAGSVWSPPPFVPLTGGATPEPKPTPKPKPDPSIMPYPMASVPVMPVVRPWLRKRWVIVSGVILIVVSAVGVFAFVRSRSDEPHRPPKTAVKPKPMTVADYVNGAGITYHAPNDDYSVALPSEPKSSGNAVATHVAGATLTISERDLGAAAPHEPLARVKAVQDAARFLGQPEMVERPEVSADGDLSLSWSVSGWDERQPSFVEQDRVVLVGSHVFVLRVRERTAVSKAFERLTESFQPNPVLRSF